MSKLNHKLIIQTFKTVGKISTTARMLNVSRNTVKMWIKKARSPYTLKFNHRTLSTLSTKRKTPSRKLDVIQEIRLVELRKTYRYDQAKLSDIYYKKYQIQISRKTVYNILKRRAPELIQSQKKHRRPRFQNGKHIRPANTQSPGYIQADVKYVTPELGGLDYTVYEYGFIDIYSRYKVALILPNLDQEATITAFRYMLKVMPCEVKHVQTDNGWEFGSKFHSECISKNVEHYYIHKSSPNENAVIERSFRTDQEEFFYYLEREPEGINELNEMFQRYLERYNNERPHFGLELKTPREVIESFNSSICGY